jgi:hypothetical protein
MVAQAVNISGAPTAISSFSGERLMQTGISHEPGKIKKLNH